MAKTNLKPLSVYVNDEQDAVIQKLAVSENRSVSNLLLTLALERAEAKGLTARTSSTRAQNVKRTVHG